MAKKDSNQFIHSFPLVNLGEFCQMVQKDLERFQQFKDKEKEILKDPGEWLDDFLSFIFEFP